VSDDDDRALIPAGARLAELQGTVAGLDDVLAAPASGAPCVHWRLRVVEFLAPGMELVHEFFSPEPIELTCQTDGSTGPSRIRFSPETMRLEAPPTLFHQGSPGAAAVAKRFGLRNPLRVEEVLVRPGELVQAEGILCDPGAVLGRGPYRRIDAPTELMDPLLRVTRGGLAIRPTLLPWALGTAAALFGTVGAVTAVARWYGTQVRPLTWPAAPAEIGAAKIVRPRWP
jgi:hypothetical protein